MSSNAILVLLAWLLVIAAFLGCIVLVRYLQHRERMALIKHGIHPGQLRRTRRHNGILRAGLITMMVGFSLTVGLYPIGFLLPSAYPTAPFHLGPWMLPGLIPFGVGLALTISYYLEQHAQPIEDVTKEKDGQKVISLEEHREHTKEREQREKS